MEMPGQGYYPGGYKNKSKTFVLNTTSLVTEGRSKRKEQESFW